MSHLIQTASLRWGFFIYNQLINFGYGKQTPRCVVDSFICDGGIIILGVAVCSE